MRYFFRGINRDNGNAVEGNVEAPSVDDAYNILANNGIVTDTLQANPVPTPAIAPVSPIGSPAPMAAPQQPMPQQQPTGLPSQPLPPQAMASQDQTASRPLPPGAAQPGGYAPSSTVYGVPLNQLNAPPPPRPVQAPSAGLQPEEPGMSPHLSNALDTALDASASQIPFDALTEKFKGKQVWVIDRKKIRRQVATVVDKALTQSMITAEGTNETRQRVAEAIQQLFGDARNLATQRSAESIQAERAGTAPASTGVSSGPNPDLEEQIDRLASTVSRAEAVLASIAAAASRIARGGGGGGGGKRRNVQSLIDESQNEVLMEIFQSNLDLRRQIRDGVKEGDKAAITLNESGAGASSNGGDAGGSDSGGGDAGGGDAGGGEPQLAGSGASDAAPS